jgi:hypothetical protein
MNNMFDRINETSFSLVDFGAFNEFPLQDDYELIRNCSGEVFILNIPYIPQGTITFDDKVTLPLAVKKPYFINFRKVKLNILAPFKYSISPFYTIHNSDRITGVTFQKKEFYFDPSSQHQHFRIGIQTTPATLNELRINPFNGNSFAITPLIISLYGKTIYSYVVNCNTEYLTHTLIPSREKCIAWNTVESDPASDFAVICERQQFTNTYEEIRIRRFSYRHANATDVLYFFIDFYDQSANESKNIHNLVSIHDAVPLNTTITSFVRSPSFEGRSIGYGLQATQAIQSANVLSTFSWNENLINVQITAGAVTTFNTTVRPYAATPLFRTYLLSNVALVSNIRWGLSLS